MDPSCSESAKIGKKSGVNEGEFEMVELGELSAEKQAQVKEAIELELAVDPAKTSGKKEPVIITRSGARKWNQSQHWWPSQNATGRIQNSQWRLFKMACFLFGYSALVVVLHSLIIPRQTTAMLSLESNQSAYHDNDLQLYFSGSRWVIRGVFYGTTVIGILSALFWGYCSDMTVRTSTL